MLLMEIPIILQFTQDYIYFEVSVSVWVSCSLNRSWFHLGDRKSHKVSEGLRIYSLKNISVLPQFLWDFSWSHRCSHSLLTVTSSLLRHLSTTCWCTFPIYKPFSFIWIKLFSTTKPCSGVIVAWMAFLCSSHSSSACARHTCGQMWSHYMRFIPPPASCNPCLI